MEQRAQGFDGAALPPDDLAHVALGHAHFDERRPAVAALDLAHVHRVGVADEPLDDHLDYFFHVAAQAEASAAVAASAFV